MTRRTEVVISECSACRSWSCTPGSSTEIVVDAPAGSTSAPWVSAVDHEPSTATAALRAAITGACHGPHAAHGGPAVGDHPFLLARVGTAAVLQTDDGRVHAFGGGLPGAVDLGRSLLFLPAPPDGVWIGDVTNGVEGRRAAFGLTWSPDGAWLFFPTTTDRVGVVERASGRVRVVDVDVDAFDALAAGTP